MRDRLLKSAAVALTVTAITVPLAHATSPDDGYKSGYPQLHAIHTYKQTTSAAASTDEGYKSGYPQLHAIHTFNAQTPAIQTTNRSFHWSDAATGAGTAAVAIFLAAAAGLVLSRRRTRIAV